MLKNDKGSKRDLVTTKQPEQDFVPTFNDWIQIYRQKTLKMPQNGFYPDLGP